jgi:predicted nucleic acid-binding protein
MNRFLNLDAIKAKSKVFIDANIFIYHFTGVSRQCTNFLKRCERNELRAYSSTNVLLEVLHRLMMIEVVKKDLLKPPNIVKKLHKNPEIVKQLDEYHINTNKIRSMGIQLMTIDQESLVNSHHARRMYGLLVNDSLIVAVMKKEKFKVLASNDDGFLLVDEINVYKPTDLTIE